MEKNMDEKKPEPKSPQPLPAAKEPRQVPPPPRWQDMIYPDRQRDPLRWLRH
jgi:hypothetical protein